MVAEAHNFKIQKRIPFHLSRRSLRFCAIGLLALQFLPALLLWDEAYIRIHDTLEGIDYQLLFNAGKLFSYQPGEVIPQVMNGQLRMAMKSGWSLVALWNWLFGLYTGYLVNHVFVHLTAFFGMYLLLKKHLIPGRESEAVVLGVALCFSWLPVFSMLGLTVAGQPLLAWAFLNFLKKACATIDMQTLLSWLVISIFPFYSDIVWAGLPLLLFAGIYWLYNFWKTGSLNRHYFMACCWMALLYVAVNWQLFQITFFTPDFISHRAEYDYFYNKKCTLWQSLKDALQVFSISHHHTGILVSLPVLLAAVWSWKWLGRHGRSFKILLVIVAVSLFYGFYNWLVWLGNDHFILMKSFKFERAIVLLPALWMVLFGLSLARLWQRRYFRRAAGLLLLCQLLMGALANDEFVHNVRQLAGEPRKPNFQAFFDPVLFNEIDRHIGKPKSDYRVVSLGMHPSAAQYNGFYTLDCHSSLYSLAYKHQFRQIMSGELAKSEVIRNEFDHFGNRCYLYSAELGKEYDAFLCGKSDTPPLKNLRLNTEALCNMSGCYLFSAIEILNAPETGLSLSGVFEGKFWRVYVYEVSGKRLGLNDCKK